MAVTKKIYMKGSHNDRDSNPIHASFFITASQPGFSELGSVVIRLLLIYYYCFI